MLKKIFLVGTIISILLCIGFTSVYADQIDYCELYGVGCQEEPEKQTVENRKIEFAETVSFRNADWDGDSVDFLFKGYNWDLDKNMKIEISLIPRRSKYPIIRKTMNKKLTQTKMLKDGTIDYKKYEASVNIDILAQYFLKFSGNELDHNTVILGSGAGPKLISV